MKRVPCAPHEDLREQRGRQSKLTSLPRKGTVSVITLDDVVALVRRELRRKLPEDFELTGETQLEDVGLSSLQVAEIVFTLEEEHEVEFDTSRAADVKTLADVVAVANEAIAAQASVHTAAVEASAVLDQQAS